MQTWDEYTVEVSGFVEELGSVTTPIVSVAVAYDDPVTYTTYILVFHQVLLIKELKCNLISPFQLRTNGIVVNEEPLSTMVRTKALRDVPPNSHAIVTDLLQIPLRLKGVFSYFETRAATSFEVSNPDQFPQLEMTSSAPAWDPYDSQLSKIEEELRSKIGVEPVVRDRNIWSARRSQQVQSDHLFDSLFIPYIRWLYTTTSVRRKGTITAEELAKRWRISIQQARRTIDRCTQLAIRDYENSLGERRLRHSNQQLWYRRYNADCYTDTMFAAVPSLYNGYKCAQIYCTDFGYIRFYPMLLESDAHKTLDLLHDNVGVFRIMIPDGAKTLTTKHFAAKAQKAGSIIRPVEAYTPNQNRAESGIRELKRMYRRAMLQSGAPAVLWDHCMQLQAEIRSHTALDMTTLQGETPYMRLFGETADISHICQFAWYEYVWHIDSLAKMENKELGRWLGPSQSVGDKMCSKILVKTGRVIVRSSVFPLSAADRSNDAIIKLQGDYEASLSEQLKQWSEGIPDDGGDEPQETAFVPYEDDSTPAFEMPEADEFTHEAYDKYISAQLMLPDSTGVLPKGTVKKRVRDDDGNYVGRAHANPIVDTSVYEIEFEDGDSGTYAANIIAENIFEQVDAEGNTFMLFDDIVDFKRGTSAMTVEEATIVVNGRSSPARTTRGWKFCVRWKDGSTNWIPLKDLKESHPVQLADFVKAHGLENEAAFVWWVPQTLKRRERIIKAAKTRYARRDQKFGIELPHSVKRALEIDAETGTTFWIDAIKKELGVVKPAIDILDEGKKAPVGFDWIPCHMVFDIKVDFSRKARFVAGGHVTAPPTSITYASVVSRESVRIILLIAALNDLEVLSADIQGAYLNAPCKETVYTELGPEWGHLRGRIAVIVKALYGLRSSGYAWRSHLAETLRSMEFTMCLADNDVWMRKATRSDGSPYWEYVLVYTDDILAVSLKPQAILDGLSDHYVLKEGSVGPPTQYLGAQVSRFSHPHEPEKEYWAMSSEKYGKEAIRNVRNWLEANGLPGLKSRASSVLPSNYRPELDCTDYCDAKLGQYYQEMIGVLRWLVELGRVNVCTEVSIMASYAAAPRRGHFDAVLHIFSFLDLHRRSRMVFDSSYVPVDDGPDLDWSDFYPNAEEAIPPNAPEAYGNSVEIVCFVDADHAGDLLTRRSRTGVLIYLNRAPVIWYSKRQNSVETSTFGSEFMALKIAAELVAGLRYKLRMMGIPLGGPAHMRVDNMSVVQNTTVPESTLKKKSNSIAFHYTREGVAGKWMKIGYENTKTNLADMFTKTQGGPERKRLADLVLF
jgi:Reverse transcriptase (RNA-dependent DNA polymerase)